MTSVKESYWSPESCWAEADHALKSVIRAALDHGVSYRESAVQKLVIDRHGTCGETITEDGMEMTADHIILCQGRGLRSFSPPVHRITRTFRLVDA